MTVLRGLFIELKPAWRDRDEVWRPAGERSAGIVTTLRPVEEEGERSGLAGAFIAAISRGKGQRDAQT